MILNDVLLTQWAESGGLSPAGQYKINPASVDLSWSGRYCIAGFHGWSSVEDADSLVLIPGSFYLLDTHEFVVIPEDCVGKLFLKSSAGRMGIEHLHAGYVDPAFSGTLTLEVEIRAPWPIELKRYARIVQLTVEQMVAPPEVSYQQVGRYNGQREPTVSKGF